MVSLAAIGRVKKPNHIVVEKVPALVFKHSLANPTAKSFFFWVLPWASLGFLRLPLFSFSFLGFLGVVLNPFEISQKANRNRRRREWSQNHIFEPLLANPTANKFSSGNFFGLRWASFGFLSFPTAFLGFLVPP